MKNQLGILGYTEINELIDEGVIEFADRKNVNPASLNVSLGPIFLEESRDNEAVSGVHHGCLSFAKRESPAFYKRTGSTVLSPGAFCLASIVEKLNLPCDIIGHLLLRSSAARMGIEHSLAGFADPNFNGHLTLEVQNILRFHSIKLVAGDQICQLIFHRIHPVPAGNCYKGKYSFSADPVEVRKEI